MKSDLSCEEITAGFEFNAETGEFFFRNGIKRKGKKAGSRTELGYVVIWHKNKSRKAHRMAWTMYYGAPPDGVIDHINGDAGDNRRANLRVVSQAVNTQNLRRAYKNSKTGVLGVYHEPSSGKYVASIQLNRKIRKIGRFATIEAASQAYLDAKRRIHEGCAI